MRKLATDTRRQRVNGADLSGVYLSDLFFIIDSFNEAFAYSLAKFSCGLFRKCHRDNLDRPHLIDIYMMKKSLGEHRSLARTRSRGYGDAASRASGSFLLIGQLH